ncbi:hypothetical protein PG996_007665 [Apiospora saccharicola]|uniref:Uncharacterized protein n=1 Tax=Apiospora saccharicola TaxID=335842 RepID=A0ABR1VF66_9PEZI
MTPLHHCARVSHPRSEFRHKTDYTFRTEDTSTASNRSSPRPRHSTHPATTNCISAPYSASSPAPTPAALRSNREEDASHGHLYCSSVWATRHRPDKTWVAVLDISGLRRVTAKVVGVAAHLEADGGAGAVVAVPEPAAGRAELGAHAHVVAVLVGVARVAEQHARAGVAAVGRAADGGLRGRRRGGGARGGARGRLAAFAAAIAATSMTLAARPGQLGSRATADAVVVGTGARFRPGAAGVVAPVPVPVGFEAGVFAAAPAVLTVTDSHFLFVSFLI